MKIFIFAGLLALTLAKETFFGDQVLTLQIENEAQAEVIRSMGNKLDFWSPDGPEHVKAGSSADVRVQSAFIPAFKTLMRRNRISFDVMIDDVQSLIDGQTKSRERGILDGNSVYDYYTYHTYDQINDWTKDMAATHSDRVERKILGTSFEGREIPMLVLSTNPNNPVILVDCGIHAREWISPAFCQCYVDRLLNDPTESSKLDGVTYHIIPSVNVDGYVFTWTDDRMWRKTRSSYGTVCKGVDPNRNFDAGFGGEGSSSNACSDTYHGPYAESEVECKALADHIRQNVGPLKAYVTFHSYSQMILYPYSYTYDLAATNDELDYYAKQGEAAIESVYKKRFTAGPGAATIYPAAGGSDDFAYDAGVPLSYTVELRDKGQYGFLLPEDQIQPVCDETTAFMDVMYNAVTNPTYQG